jgi:hypothetical protein
MRELIFRENKTDLRGGWRKSRAGKLTRFEKYAASIGATELEAMKHCVALKQWAAAQRFVHYVPEELLQFWGLEIHSEDDKLFTTK